MYTRRRGLGQSDSDMCLGVPCSSIPWYCNVPLIAFGFSDCLSIFQQQAGNQAAGITAIAGSAAAGAVQGTGTGACTTLLGGGDLATSVCSNPLLAVGLGAAIIFGLVFVAAKL